MIRKVAIAGFVLPLGLALAAQAWAGPRGHGQDDQRAPQPAPPAFVGPEHGQGRESLSDSVRRVSRDTHGQVLSAERVPYDGRNVNRIKVVDQSGRVRVIMDDPNHRPSPPARDDDD